jgi:hypothetical protein
MKSTQYRPRPAAILVLSARARVRALWGLSGWRGNEGIGKL